MNIETNNMILALLVGGGILAAYLLISQALMRKKRSSDIVGRVQTPPSGMSAYDLGSETSEQEQLPGRQANFMDMALGLIFKLFDKNQESEYQSVRKKMLYAGIRNVDAPIFYLFYQYIISPIIVLIAISYLYADKESPNFSADIFVGIVLLFLGLFVHKLYIKNKIDKRQKELVRSFPDALDLMLVCVESGQALDGALAKVCNELGAAHPLMTEELNRTRMELSVLSDRTRALQGLGDRCGVSALKALSAALVQSEKFGTSLGDTLRVMSDDYRQTRLLLAEEKAAKLPVIITVPLITMLLPAMFIIILSPAIIAIIAQGGLFGGK
jgi:tight adherence protein C